MGAISKMQLLKGFSLQARDGEIGSLKQAWFDERDWSIRYLIVDAGNWLLDRDVLVSPRSIIESDIENGSLIVALSRQQVKDSPTLQPGTSLTRRYEEELHRFYGWEPYWAGDLFIPESLPASLTGATPHEPAEPADDSSSHLRSNEEITGYSLLATDGEYGQVDDLLVDDETWKVRYIEASASGILPGKHVIISPAWVTEIDWVEGRLQTRLGTETIETAPDYDDAKRIDRDYELRLFAHYGDELEQGS